MNEKILIVEDEEGLVLTLSDRLTSEGFLVHTATDGKQGVVKAKSDSFDLIILDIMLPEMNGFDVCREIRSQHINAPILFLTARGEVTDKVVGLKLGGDDYLTKPFSLRELQARIKARLRRPVQTPESADTGEKIISCRGITLNPSKREVSKNGVILSLTGTEFNLLWLMMSQPGVVFNRDRLLDELRNRELEAFDRSIDAHISHLRKKVEDSPKNPSYIVTVWGTGYKFVAE